MLKIVPDFLILLAAAMGLGVIYSFMMVDANNSDFWFYIAAAMTVLAACAIILMWMLVAGLPQRLKITADEHYKTIQTNSDFLLEKTNDDFGYVVAQYEVLLSQLLAKADKEDAVSVYQTMKAMQDNIDKIIEFKNAALIAKTKNKDQEEK